MKRRWSFFSCNCWAWSYSVSDMEFFLTFFFFCLHNRHMLQMQMQFFQRARLPVSTPVLFEWFLNSGILDHAWSWNSKAAKVIFFTFSIDPFVWRGLWNTSSESIEELIISLFRLNGLVSFFLDGIGCETWLWLLVKSFLSLRNLC